jgi:hypothetical protein
MESNKDNRDILKWKRLIDSIQTNEQSVDEPIAEGTWSIPETPEQVKKLSNLLKNPLDAETALDELYDVFGDDELFDTLEGMKKDEPETDVRHVVISRLKDMNFIKEVRENAKQLEAEELEEGGVHKIQVDQQTHIEAEHHNVVVSSNDMGIIVDIYDKNSDNIDTNTYWNDDVMDESTETVNEHEMALLGKVARQMEADAHSGDYTAIEELLHNVTEEEMEAFLSDHRSSNEWPEESVNE